MAGVNRVMPSLNLRARLLEVASYVREGAFLADIGTDHAYLPLYLLLNGRIDRALASDVSKGPLDRARVHVQMYPSVASRIRLVQCDGLCGIENYRPNDIAICGMGGELIEKIISESEFIKNGEINLILQPMTMEHKLRKYLVSCGYEIKNESIVCEGSKLYQIMLASYTAKKSALTDLEALLGVHNIERRTREFYMLVKKHINALNKQINGLDISGRESAPLREMLEMLMALYKENEDN